MPRKKNARTFKWNLAFDRLLAEIIDTRSSQTWTNIAKQLETNILAEKNYAHLTKFPNGKQCRERWVDHLDPNVSHDSFTHEELDYIFKRKMEGAGFAEIGRELGHSARQVKNSYHNNKHKRVGTPTEPRAFEVELPNPESDMGTSSTSVSDDPVTPRLFSDPFINRNLSFFSVLSEPSCDLLNELHDLRGLGEVVDDMLREPCSGYGAIDKGF
ncbi:hypothetical protein [Legionella quateirensis]|uniref:Myb-like domain-containing protein n=1 Tax=Legionella quateirensis TaxID=45072 RepID=A0A378KQQ0_9GAMM|nr:hypothetical protein [Legionella quateirensis]KTD54703.1 hypothetical protein Lqua_0210 [Legionella quateirensis]STY16882.1 Uncharacterised protein [Legionella quateirensis]